MKRSRSQRSCDKPSLPTSAKPSWPKDRLVIVSQNVNTLYPLLQELQASSQQKLNFTKPSPAKRQRRRSSSPPSSSSDDGQPGPEIAATTSPIIKEWNPCTDIITRHQEPHIICLQEVKALARDPPSLRRAIDLVTDPAKTGVAGQIHRYVAHSSLSRSLKGRNFGLTTFVRDDVKVVEVREVDWDKEGRVMIAELEDLVIFNVYALNGSEYPWIDPSTGRARGTRNQRKREFNELLMQEVQRQRQRTSGKPCLLIGDFNISLKALDCHPRLRTEHPHDVARAHFKEKIIPGMGVADIYRQLHGNTKAYSWFAVGKPYRTDCARVDFALLSESAVPAVIRMEYMERDQGDSDHCPMVVELDRNELATRRIA